MREHTPTPWRWLPEEGQFIVAAKDLIVAEIPCQGCNPADGEFIVRACNSFDDLLAAAKAFVSWVDDCWDSWAINDRDTPKAKADYEAAKAAIARAEAKQP